jgi:alkylated DNA repair protein (DNA oxidative demethylase)
MSVALTNCGALGWTTDRRGYRYTAADPATGHPWPAMPGVFEHLARKAAQASGFADFVPDACLMNRYEPGSRLALHQDRNEHDFDAPIVSVSLGMSARFLFGGLQRTVSPEKIIVHHGDVVVWGGEDRLRFHGVMPHRAMLLAGTGAHGSTDMWTGPVLQLAPHGGRLVNVADAGHEKLNRKKRSACD